MLSKYAVLGFAVGCLFASAAGSSGESFAPGQSVEAFPTTALLVVDKSALSDVEREFRDLIAVGGPIGVIDVADVTGAAVDLGDYWAIACFSYGGQAVADAFSQTVADAVMGAVSNGATLVVSREAGGAKLLQLAGYVEAGMTSSTWTPAYRDSKLYASVPPGDPLFSGVSGYGGDPSSHSYTYWQSGDFSNLAWRADNTQTYPRKYTQSAYAIDPDGMLSTGFGAYWYVTPVAPWDPFWLCGRGRIVQISSVIFTFDQETQNGGYIGIAGRRILRNLATLPLYEEPTCGELLDEAMAAIDELEAALAQSQATNAVLQAQLAEAQATNAALLALVGDLNATVAGLEQDLAAALSESDQLRNQVSTLSNTVTTLQSELAQSHAANAALQAQVDQITWAVDGLRAANALLQAELAQAQADIACLQTQLSQALADKAALQGQVDQLTGTVAALHAQIGELNDEVADLEADLAEALADNAAKQAAINRLAAKVVHLEAANKQLMKVILLLIRLL